MQGSLTLSGGIKAPGFPPGTLLGTWQAAGYYLAFLAAQILLHLVLPGKVDQGIKLKNGSRLTYKFTGPPPQSLPPISFFLFFMKH
jgi:hypothetical protein